MGESLWLAVCSRRDSLAPLIVSRRVDDDGLQAFAADVGACDPDIVEVRVYPLASERTVTFAGPGLHRLAEEHKEREMYARLKAKFEPAAVVGVPGPVHVVWPDPVSRGYVVPSGETPYDVAGKVNADLGAPFTAVVVDGVVRLHLKEWGALSPVATPEAVARKPPK